jgi:hypothetical protein
MIKNIYETNILSEQMNKTQKLVNSRAALARNPNNTNVIPPYYNVLFEGQERFEPNKYKHTVLMEYGDKLTDDNFVDTFDFSTKVNRVENKKNEFLGQFDLQKVNKDSQPTPKNAIGKVNMNALERDMQINGGYSNFDQSDMTYGIVDKEHFTHNNMQAFTKGKGIEHNNFNPNNRNYLVELFTGSSVNNIPKKETPRFFLPEKDVTFGATRGMPNQSDFLQSRFVVSDVRQGEKPFEPVKVTPGLGLNYYEEARFGYHDPYRALPKTVDELRVTNKPKLTYKEPVIPGKKGEYRSVQAPVAKNRTEKFKEYNPYDMVPVGGEYSAPTSRDKFILNENARVDKKAIVGTPHHSSVNWQYVYEKDTFKSNKQELGAEPTTAAKGQYHYNPEYPMPTTFEVFEQDRETTNRYNIGPVGSSAIGSMRAVDYNDVAKQTIKQTTENNNQLNGVTQIYQKPTTHLQDQARQTIKQTTENTQQMNGVTQVYQKPTTHLQDQARQTIKQTTEHMQQTNGVTQVYQKPTTHLQDQARKTIRETMENTQQLNGVTQVYQKPTTHLQDQARMTIKQTTENTQQLNGVTQIYQKPTSHLQDQAKMTTKQTTENNNYLSGITPIYASPTVQYQDEAKMTTKQTTENNTYLSGISPINAAPTTQYQDEAKMTVKQTTENNNYLSGITPMNYSPTTQFQDEAKTTIKQTTVEYYHAGPIGNRQLDAPTSNMAEQNMFIDERREKSNMRKAPTNVGGFNGPEKKVVNLTKYNNPLLYEHFNHPHSEQVGNLKFMQTKSKQDLLNIETERINPYVLTSIVNNPLVNNVLIQNDNKNC